MAKQAKTDRQAVIDSIRSQQSKRENRRGVAIVGAIVSLIWYVMGAEDRFLVRVFTATSS